MSEIKLTPGKRFWLLLKPDKREITNLYIYGIVIGLMNLVLPLGIQSIINLIQGGAVSTSWIVLVILVSGAAAISGIMQINQLRITENLQQKIFARAAFDFVYRIPRIQVEHFFKLYGPELMNRFFDVVSVQKGITKILIEFSSASFQVIFGLILLSLYHPFFIVFSLILVFIVWGLLAFTVKSGMKTSLEESKYKYKIAFWLEEVARASTTFKLAGNSTLPLSKTDNLVHDYSEAREKHFAVLKLQYILMVFFKVLVLIGLLLIGGKLVIDQQMNIGQFVASEIVILMIVNSVEKLIVSFESIYDVLTSLEKLGQVTDFKLEKDHGVQVNAETKGFALKTMDLSFKYPNNQKWSLQNINLDIKAGQKVLFQGGSQSGKATLLSILSGVITHSNGTYTIENTPFQNFDYGQVRSKIGTYIKEETLFEGTLYENITLGREGVGIDEVLWAVDKMNLNKFIQTLPDGFDTAVLPGGKQFSKSIVSKILAARSIVCRPRLLVFELRNSELHQSDLDPILSFILSPENEWTVLLSCSQPIKQMDLIDQTIFLQEGKQIIK